MTEKNRKELLENMKTASRLLNEQGHLTAEIDFLEKNSKDLKKYVKFKRKLERVNDEMNEFYHQSPITNCKHEIYVYLGKKDASYYDLGIEHTYKCLDCGEEKHFYEHPDADKERFNEFINSNIIIDKVGYLFDDVQSEYYNSLISNSAEDAKGKVLAKYYKKNK